MKRFISILILTLMLLNISFVYGNDKGDKKEVFIQGVKTINQHPELPTGCEATALTILLNYFGIDVTKEEIANSLPKGPKPYWKNGKLYGADPTKEFVGNPYDKGSFGVFHQPILKMIERYFPNRSENLTNKSFDEILNVVKSGRPVMIWATIKMHPTILTSIWELEDGSSFQWKGNEHALILIGYNDREVIVSDPYTGKIERYDKNIFIKRWEEQGKQAVTIKDKNIEVEKLTEKDILESNSQTSFEIDHNLVISSGNNIIEFDKATEMPFKCGETFFVPMEEFLKEYNIKYKKEIIYISRKKVTNKIKKIPIELYKINIGNKEYLITYEDINIDFTNNFNKFQIYKVLKRSDKYKFIDINWIAKKMGYNLTVVEKENTYYLIINNKNQKKVISLTLSNNQIHNGILIT